MIKNLCEHEDNSDGSEDEEGPENDGSDEEMQTDEEPAGSGDEQEDEEPADEEYEDGENDEEEEQEEEDDEEEDHASKPHPYPTPPPDANDIAKANMSLGNGIKKIKIGSAKRKLPKEKKSKMAATNTDKPTDDAKPAKGKTIMAHALNAIKALDSKSGSSVSAIVAYIKSSGYKMDDQQRFAKTLHKRLKNAVANGELVQVKYSFKLSAEAKKKSMAVEKMKEKQNREKLKLKAAEAKAAKKAEEKKKKKTEKTMEKEQQKKKKATERKTKEVSSSQCNRSVLYHL